jgi:hypothetical protein
MRDLGTEEAFANDTSAEFHCAGALAAGEEPPCSRYALEHMCTALLKGGHGTVDEIIDSGRHKDFSCAYAGQLIIIVVSSAGLSQLM